jgi:hypothetical protein
MPNIAAHIEKLGRLMAKATTNIQIPQLPNSVFCNASSGMDVLWNSFDEASNAVTSMTRRWSRWAILRRVSF